MLAALPGAPHGWERETLPPGTYWAHDVASAGPGEAILLHRTIAGTFATVRRHGEDPEDTQQLDSGWNFYPTLDASPLGGAVAAWYNEDETRIRVAERPPTGGSFAQAAAVPGGPSNYSYGQPLVRVNARGDAIVVYLATTGGLQQVRALYRPAGGEFGEPENVSTPAPWDSVFPRDVALAPDGTAVVGFVQAGRANAALRPAGGTFGPAQAIGGAADEHSWQSPRVGIDAAGNAVIAWLEMGGDLTGPVRVAFRAAGTPVFGVPRETGLTTSDLGRIRLAVSDPGEIVLLVEAESSNGDGESWHMDGLRAVMGNAGTGALGSPGLVAPSGGSYPQMAMNGRGDAVVAWDVCCPLAVRARRREPREPFGPAEDLQPPIELTGPRGGIAIREADVDERGNARVTFEDFEEDLTYLATSEPFAVTDPPPVDALGAFVSPVVVADPPPEDGVPAGEEGSFEETVAPSSSAPPPPMTPPPPPPARSVPQGAPAADRDAPVVTVRVGRVVKGARPRLPVRLTCSEACTARLTGTFAGRAIPPAQAALAPGRVARLRLPLGRRVARRRGRARVAVVAVDAVDAAGNSTLRRASAVVRTRR